ncbi:MAG: hypothetical protein Q4Q62_00185 [Thermoplasmata archaeon]|nr:hypothetical protein [Thermoplasmata archaeon]
MEIFGLSDPWIIGGYALSILSVVFCCAYAYLKGIKAEDEEDD